MKIIGKKKKHGETKQNKTKRKIKKKRKFKQSFSSACHILLMNIVS